MTKKILIATHNENKVKEFRQILPEYNFISLNELKDFNDYEEVGSSFEENSFLKADHFFSKHKLITIADDSGLEVLALNNEPGVNSKRYSGGNDSDNNKLLLKNLEGIEKRNAKFRCVLTLILEDGDTTQFEGELEGLIALEPKGDSGFGYDPIFYIPNMQKTLAELGSNYKDKHSHRSIALNYLKEYLDENISNKWYSRWWTNLTKT